jgi:integrase
LDEIMTLAQLETAEDNLVLKRDQAGAVLLFLSGMRVSTLGSLPVEAVDIENRTIKQWPSLGVRTKNDKTATTYLLEIPELIRVVDGWNEFVRIRLPLSAMWYTPIISELGNQRLSARAPGKNRHIAVAKRMRKLFRAAGLRSKSPHKFRHGFAVYALQHCQTMADYKAVSVNLMHNDIRITDSTYARLAGAEVQQRISRLSQYDPHQSSLETDLAVLINGLSNSELSQVMTVIARRLTE